MAEDLGQEVLTRLRQAQEIHAQAARVDPSAFMEFVLKDEMTGKPIEMAPMHQAWQSLMTSHKRLLLWSHTEGGKAIDIRTPIPTPAGWSTMAELKKGDRVFDSRGRPCRVTFATGVQRDRKVWRVVFDDGEVLLADSDHQWLVYSHLDFARSAPSPEHRGNGPLCACGCGLRVTRRVGAKRWNRFVHNHHRRVSAPRVLTTEDMRQQGVTVVSGARKRSGEAYPRYRWRIPLVEPVQYVGRKLPVHPYVLGAWLGEGDTDTPTLTVHTSDRAIYDRCVALEGGIAAGVYRDRRHPKVLRGNIGGYSEHRSRCLPDTLRKRLRTLGVLGNKHIPSEYLEASVDQRRELLAGLLDTDGSIEGRGGKSRVEFTQCKQALAEQVLQLVRSLGFKAAISEEDAKIDGRVVGRKWRVTFTAREPVFWLPRKRLAQKKGKVGGKAAYRYITAIEPVPSVPVRCIAVDSPDRTYLAGRGYVVTHNTQQVSIGRTLYELGRNPNQRIVVISNTHEQAAKIVRSVAKYVEGSAELSMVFPRLKKGDPWTSHHLFVQRTVMSKDPSLQACGIHGNIVGARIDLLIFDDILDYENCRTPAAREDLWKWIHATLVGRLTRDAKVWIVGNAYHPDDSLHRFARQPGWTALRYPVMDPTTGESRWPERWPLDRIEERRGELGPLEFARQMMCQARDDSESRFKQEWIDSCLDRGRELKFLPVLVGAERGRIYTGVDLAVQKHAAAGQTVLFTIWVHGDGSRQVVNIEAGRWAGPDIVGRIVDTHHRYNSICVVENNAAQQYLVQFANAGSAVPIRPFTTGRNKAHPEFGVESLAVEMAAAKWIIPNDGQGVMHSETAQWIQEMLFFDPMAHTGDRLMASWFAREGARMGARKAESGRVDLTSR